MVTREAIPDQILSAGEQMSFESFKRNAGWRGILKVLIVGGVFSATACLFGGAVFAAWATSWVLGWPLGRWFAADPEKRSPVQKGFSYVIVFGSMILGQVRSSMNLSDEMLLVILSAGVGLYLSSYVFLLADSTIVMND